jgi:hypothetical protein
VLTLTNSKNNNPEIEEHLKLALYGAGCTKDYAEEQTKALLKIINKDNRNRFTPTDHWYFFCSVIGASLFIFPNPTNIGSLLIPIYFGIGVTIGNVWFHYIRKVFTWLHSKWQKKTKMKII